MDAAQVVAHRLAQAELERIGDQCVTDRHLLHAGHGTQEVGEVVAVEVVAGVQAQALRERRLRREGRIA